MTDSTYKKYDAYKETDIDWLGEIPENWDVSRLRYLSTVNTGSKNTEDAKEEGRYPFYVRSPRICCSESYSYDEEAVLTSGDGAGVCDIFHYVNGKYELHQRMYRISNFKNLEGKFLYYYMIGNFEDDVIRYSAKSTVDSLRMYMFKDFSVALPPKNKQKLIADFLDEKTEKIDTIREKNEKLIKKLEEYKQSLISKAVTKGLDSDAEMKETDIDWLDEIPQNWNVQKLKRVSKMTTGWTPSTSDAENFQGQHNWVSIGDMTEDTISETEKKITDKAIKEAGMNPAPSGSVLFSFKLSVGKTAIAETDVYTNEAIAAFSPSEEVSSRFLYYALSDYLIENSTENIYGAKIMNQQILRNAEVVIPTKEQQKQIADFLDEKTATIDEAIEKLHNENKLLEEYKQSLISHVVTGKTKV